MPEIKGPSLGLAMIVKNEARNLSRLLQSVKGCFDEIHITDTGSTDETVEFLELINKKIKDQDPLWLGLPEIQIHHFEWINDFAAARNYSFSHVLTDYIMWMDADDELYDPQSFIEFKKLTMRSADQWLATYNYALDPDGSPRVSFLRERIIKRSKAFEWRYFIHEGLVALEPVQAMVAKCWAINHRRDELDQKADQSRNLKVFEIHAAQGTKMDSRMLYYWGKELFEHGDKMSASAKLLQAIENDDMSFHDKISALQFAAQCAIDCNHPTQSLSLALKGLETLPSHAEFWCQAGDSHLLRKDWRAAQIFYRAALATPTPQGEHFVLSREVFRGLYPLEQLAQIYLKTGQFSEAEPYIAQLRDLGSSKVDEFTRILDEGLGLEEIATRDWLEQTEDVIITCPPGGITADWDEEKLKYGREGLGGSETACVELARWIRKLTGRQVIVFNKREAGARMESGVQYLPQRELAEYLGEKRPHTHIAWRHSVRLTQAPTYVWSHDLITPGGEHHERYTKYITLSPFHRAFVKSQQNVPNDKLLTLRNGIDPRLFEGPKPYRNPAKVVYTSSPDRGLRHAIEIMKRARLTMNEDLELHVFYGFDGMIKAGRVEDVQALKEMMAPEWIHFHGSVSKEVLIEHLREAAVWLYPADFIETSCISAIEALCAGAFPITRNCGALPWTLADAAEKNMALILDLEVDGPKAYDDWSVELIKVLADRSWERVDVDLEKYSWENVTKEFIEELHL